MPNLHTTKSLQSLRKCGRSGDETPKDKNTSQQGSALPIAAKVDRVAAYMERQFYEQFKPKRDRASRIRKTGKEQRQQQKACAHFRKRTVDDDSSKRDELCVIKTTSSKKRKRHSEGDGKPERDDLKAVWDKVLANVHDL